MKEKTAFKQLMDFAGNKKCLTYASVVLSSISVVVSMVPFIYLWLIVRDIFHVMPEYHETTEIGHYGMCLYCDLYFGVYELTVL